MIVDLCGWRSDNGAGVALNPLEPRGFRAVAFSTGVANKIVVRGHSVGVARVAIYTNSGVQNRPLQLLAYTDEFGTDVGSEHSLELSSPIPITIGVSYHIVIMQVGGVARIRAGAISSTQRNQGAAYSAIGDDFSDTFVYVTQSAVTVGPYAMLISDSVGIASIDKLNTAQTSTAVFNADFAATNFSITDGETEKSAVATTVSSASASFIVPSWVDGETAVKVGPISVTATDGSDTTTEFNGELEFWSAQPDNATFVKFTAVTLTSVDPNNIGAAFDFDPPLKIGTQCVFDASRFLISDHGVLTTVGLEDYEGQSIFWFLDPDDHIARDFTLDTSEGAVAPVMPADRTVTVYEGATTLGTFPAISGTPPISYALGGDDAALFTINSSEAKVDPVGELTLGQSGVITVTPENSAGTGDPQTINWSVIAAPNVGGLTMVGFVTWI
jgi:hypothetical protein